MKQGIPKPAIAGVLVLLAVILVLVFAKASGGSAPQVDPSTTPDYSKMTPEQMSAAHNAEPGNAPPGGAGSRADDGHGAVANASPQNGRP